MSKSLKFLSKLIKTGLFWVEQKHFRYLTSLHRLIWVGSLSFLLTVASPFIPYSLLSNYYLPRLQVLAQNNDARKAEADRLLQQGIEQFQTSKVEAALQSWQQALDIYQEIKDRKGEGIVLGSLGLAYNRLKNYPKAIEYYKRCLKIVQKIEDRKGEGATLRNLSAVYYNMGDYAGAIEYQEQSLKITQEIKDRPEEAKSLVNLGLIHNRLGNYLKAIEYHEQSLKIFQELKDRKGELYPLSSLGLAHLYLGNYPKAIEYQEQSLKIAQEIKDSKQEGDALGNLGLVYDSMGDYSKAIDYYGQSLKIFQEIKDRRGESNTLGNLGLAYYNMKDYPKAINYHGQSLKIFQEIQDRQREGTALGNIGLAYYSMGDYPKAINYQQQYLKIAQETKDREGEGLALSNFGVVYYSMGDYQKAIEYQQRCLKITQEMKDREGEGTALNNLGLAYYKIGNLRNAESTLFESMKVLESLRDGLKDNNKVTIFETQRNTYSNLQKVLITQNKTDAALVITERGRARAFVELLASKLSFEPSEQLSAPPNLNQIKQIAKSQNATIVEYSRIIDDFKIANKAQDKESELYIWVIKPTGEVTFRKSDLKPLWQKENTELAQLVNEGRSSIGARGRGLELSHPGNASSSKNNLKRLHEILIKPIADLLPTSENDKVIFIPQDALFLVPFPALLDENNKFLIEKHTILTSPAIQVLDLTRKQKQKVNVSTALVVGNPTMSPEVVKKFSLPPLPGAEKEAVEIAKMLNTQPLLTNKATKAEVLKNISNAKIIHLATHGLIDDINNFGVPGAVVLAPDGKDNGLLTSGEILDLKLGADLVVLSACDTGAGNLTGDGVIGLSRSLISAGTPSVIVTLWMISDVSTKVLMTDFYRNLEQNQDKAVALRKAMLNTMKQHPNPVEWAAFTLIGEAI